MRIIYCLFLLGGLAACTDTNVEAYSFRQAAEVASRAGAYSLESTVAVNGSGRIEANCDIDATAELTRCELITAEGAMSVLGDMRNKLVYVDISETSRSDDPRRFVPAGISWLQLHTGRVASTEISSSGLLLSPLDAIGGISEHIVEVGTDIERDGEALRGYTAKIAGAVAGDIRYGPLPEASIGGLDGEIEFTFYVSARSELRGFSYEFGSGMTRVEVTNWIGAAFFEPIELPSEREAVNTQDYFAMAMADAIAEAASESGGGGALERAEYLAGYASDSMMRNWEAAENGAEYIVGAVETVQWDEGWSVSDTDSIRETGCAEVSRVNAGSVFRAHVLAADIYGVEMIGAFEGPCPASRNRG
jgi:hypothetical protein